MEIKEVVPLFPELVNSNFEELVREKYKNYLTLEDKVFSLRDLLRQKEEELEKAKVEWESLEVICKVKYEEEPISDETKGDSDINLLIINPSDRRN